jgi:uncharacterized protein (TIGR02147 family)
MFTSRVNTFINAFMNELIPYYYQIRLREELMKRIDRNARYSVRSFASALGMGSSALSQILAGKRSVSTKLVNRVLDCLEMSAAEQRSFVASVIEEKKAKGLQRVSPLLAKKLKEVSESIPPQNMHGVGIDEFRVIADWYHYAIMELTFARDFDSDPKWIAKQLGLSLIETKLAIQRLLELELLEYQNAVLKKTNWTLDTVDKTKTSVFHRKRQKQILEKSMHSLEHDPIEVRNHSGLTVCIDPKNIPQVKAKIQKMMNAIAQTLVEGTPEKVYELTVNLFPLQTEIASSGAKKLEKKV